MFELLSEIISALRIRERMREMSTRYRVTVSASLLILLIVVGYRDTILDAFDYAAVSAEVIWCGNRIPRLSKIDKLSDDFSKEISARMHIYYVDSTARSQGNAWNGAQAFIGLGSPLGQVSADTAAFFRRTLDTDCSCWLDQGLPSTPATAWVIMAARPLGENIADTGVKGLLKAQAVDGAWPEMIGAKNSPNYDSLYATAIAVRALLGWQKQHRQDEPLSQVAQLALDRATIWLIESNATDSTLWVDYPHHQSHFESVALTADALSDLIADGEYNAIAPRAEAFLAYISNRSFSEYDLESSDSNIDLQNGNSVQDRTVYATFGSIVRFLAVGYSHFTTSERISAVRWIDSNILSDTDGREFPGKEWALAEIFSSLQDLRTAALVKP